MYLKIVILEPSDWKRRVQNVIDQSCQTFYDMKMLGIDDLDLEDSLMDKIEQMSIRGEDEDKVKYQWAYNMPCALLVNGGIKFWTKKLKTIFKALMAEKASNIKNSLAAGFKEIIKLVEIDKLETKEERDYFLEVLNQLLSEDEEVA